MSEHKFGGPWTEVKLDTLTYYLRCFTKALSTQQFELWYIDAFAGSGSREVETQVGGILDGTPVAYEKEILAGSARHALEIEPPFHRFLFVEKDDKRYAALSELKRENHRRDIKLIRGDANAVMKNLAASPEWSNQAAKRCRGVVFLDPYALQVDWNTLAVLAGTKKLDVWYLFPLRDVTRQLARKHSGIGPKATMLDRVLGPEWTNLYSLPETKGAIQLSFLEAIEEPIRNVNQNGIETWIRDRLLTLFPWVSPPLPILTEPGRQIFSLFLGISNDSVRAIDLAEKFQRYAFRQVRQAASRRRSVP